MNTYKKDYPRPQFVRNGWENLNGKWNFCFDDDNRGEGERWFLGFGASKTILVPFTYETEMSGIGEEKAHAFVWYQREVEVDREKLAGHRLILHFEGSDYLTKVWVGDCLAGIHEGGYARFSFDITNLVEDGKNRITVKAEDFPDPQQPRGKQRWVENSFLCWYVQTTGIWKTVWLEYVPENCLDSVKMTPCLREKNLLVEYRVNIPQVSVDDGFDVEAVVSYEGRSVAKTTTAIGKNVVLAMIGLEAVTADEPWGIYTWAPENPRLYDIKFRLLKKGCVCDEVCSYFAMREIRIEGKNILLNGEPLYQRLILDQGYWEKSHLTPPNEEALIEDIEKIHAMGYNGLRKHQKTEDERFLYWCDVKGMLVWSEAPAAYSYTDQAAEHFMREWMEIVRQNYNHPCIITWVPFNESWGISHVKTKSEQQHFTEAVYHMTKSIDPYRPVITNDGWEHTVSDIITLHDYEESGKILRKRYVEYKDEIMSSEVYHSCHKSAFANGFAYQGQPVILSEFGGIAFDGEEDGWGYGNKVATEDEFLARFDQITTSVKEIPYVCGYCYTQVTDVQQEINGLMDIKRRFKVSPDRIREINERTVGVLWHLQS